MLITHYMDEAALADRIIVMSGGSVCLDGTPKDVLTQRERIKSLGLDTPQVTELMYNLKACGFDVNDKIINVEECVNELLRLIKKEKND